MDTKAMDEQLYENDKTCNLTNLKYVQQPYAASSKVYIRIHIQRSSLQERIKIENSSFSKRKILTSKLNLFRPKHFRIGAHLRP